MQISRKQVEEIARAARQYQHERDDHPEEVGAPLADSTRSGEQQANYFGLVDELPEEHQKDLLALLWLGRGDYPAFEEARAEANQKWEQKDAIVSQISESEAVDLYLKEGLRKAEPM